VGARARICEIANQHVGDLSGKVEMLGSPSGRVDKAGRDPCGEAFGQMSGPTAETFRQINLAIPRGTGSKTRIVDSMISIMISMTKIAVDDHRA
jgi:hypothetical protein